MQINLYLISFVILLGIIFSSKDSLKIRRLYIIICSIILIFVAAMRSPEWMTTTYQKDTLNYKMYFEDSFYMGWREIWQQVYFRYVMNMGDGDVGFVLLNKILSFITHEFHIYSIIADLIFFIPFGLLLYRYTTNIYQLIFAFIFYIALVQTFLLAGARQMFALGFDMMALLFVIDKKPKWSLLCFLLGVSIHFSSLLFIIPLVLIWLEVRPKMLKLSHLLCFLCFPLVLLFPNELIVFMGNMVGMDKYADYGKGEIQGGAELFILLIETLSILCLIGIKKKNMFINRNIRYFYVMAPLFTITAPLIRSNGSMIRVSLYFHLFLTLLVPFAIESIFNGKLNKIIGYAFVIGLLSFLTLSGGSMTYYFYWQY